MSLLDISQRRVEQELLDELAAVDPQAIDARADLVRLNARMRAPRILAEHLHAAFPDRKPKNLIELGAGDGQFLLAVGRLLGPAWKELEVVLVDRHRCVSQETRIALTQLGWTVRIAGADAMEWLRVNPLGREDVVVSNLFIHHFDREPMWEIFGVIAAQAGHFVACEPRRSWPALWGARMLRFSRCNPVTRHDAVLSVRAGFAGRELSRVWPQSPRWQLVEGDESVALHFFSAHYRQ